MIRIFNAIDSILERHPEANGMLLLIGTNDAMTVTVHAADFRK